MSEAIAIYLCTCKEKDYIEPNDSDCTEDFSGASVSDEFTKALSGDADHTDDTGALTIDSQRQLLRRYAEANLEPDRSILEYADEDDTLSLYQRPAFLRLIEDAKKGVFQVLLFGDITRLGTDKMVTDDYLKRVFPLLGIRVIIADSAYDSNRSGRSTASAGMAPPTIEPEETKSEIGYAFVPSAADADYYRYEHSRKIRAGIQAKWEQGQNTASHPPYGYRKDKTARGGWAIDPEAAQVVRQIFEKAGEGMQVKDIAAFLNGQGIAPPSVYREQKEAANCEAANREATNREASSGEGLTGEELPGETPTRKETAHVGNRKISASESLWDNEKIRSILSRYAYTGANVYHPHSQSGSRSPGDFGWSESQAGQKVTENAHEAIVTKAQYEQAQSQRQRRRSRRYRNNAQYVLKGKVRCGVCRLAMSRIHQAGGDAFYCSHRKYTGTHSACCSEYIPATLIEQAARRQLREWQQSQETAAKVEDAVNQETASEAEAVKSQAIPSEATGVKAQETVIDAADAENQETAIDTEQEQPFDETVEPYIETVYIYNADRIEVVFKSHGKQQE